MTIQYQTVQQTTKAIGTIKRMGVRFDTLVHVTAVSCIKHAEDSGDFTLASKLVKAMPKSARGKALVHWFTMFSPCQWSKEADQFKKTKGEKAVAFDLQGAEATPFYELTPEKDPAPITIEAIIASIKSRVKKSKDQPEPLDVDKLVGALHTLTVEQLVA